MKSAANLLQNKENPLAEEVLELHQIIEQKEQKIDQLLDYIQLLRQKRFGRSTEQANKDQFNLFDEAELEQLLAEFPEQPTAEQDEKPTQAKTDKPRQKPT